MLICYRNTSFEVTNGCDSLFLHPRSKWPQISELSAGDETGHFTLAIFVPGQRFERVSIFNRFCRLVTYMCLYGIRKGEPAVFTGRVQCRPTK